MHNDNVIISFSFFRMMNQDGSKKRSKLVLPSPQITDAELEEVTL